jgi:large subunit ribosomal protein L32e
MSIKRKKPIFFRQGWDRYIRLGKTVKKRRKWRAAKGGDSKTRLKENGRPIRPTIGWGSSKKIRDQVAGFAPVRIETEKDFENIKDKKTQAAIISGNVGAKKREQLIKAANDKGIKILNRYRNK